MSSMSMSASDPAARTVKTRDSSWFFPASVSSGMRFMMKRILE